MSSPPITTVRRLRRGVSTAGIVAFALLVTACQGTWGIRSSFRTYVAGPAGGTVTTLEGATWVDAAGPGKGPFRWPIDWATFDPGTETGSVQFRGGVRLQAHPTPDGHVLDLTLWHPRLDIAGDVGTLVADLAYRPYDGTAPSPLPTFEAAVAVPFATVDLSGTDWTLDGNNTYSVEGAPMVGIDAAMELIGFDQFYGTSVALDPLSFSFNPDVFAPGLLPQPQIVVSQTAGLRAGDQIIVWGRGFDPTAHVGTRPPLAGQPSGAYVTFGRFGSPWKPSSGAPSSSRVVIDQKWALPAASRAILDPSGTGSSFATIDGYGRFAAVVTVGESASAGIYGVYVYPGSGAVNAGQELEVPVTLAP